MICALVVRSGRTWAAGCASRRSRSPGVVACFASTWAPTCPSTSSAGSVSAWRAAAWPVWCSAHRAHTLRSDAERGARARERRRRRVRGAPSRRLRPRRRWVSRCSRSAPSPPTEDARHAREGHLPRSSTTCPTAWSSLLETIMQAGALSASRRRRCHRTPGAPSAYGTRPRRQRTSPHGCCHRGEAAWSPRAALPAAERRLAARCARRGVRLPLGARRRSPRPSRTAAGPHLLARPGERRGRSSPWSAIGRMYVGAHLPMDVIGGAALGWAVGAFVHLIWGAPGHRPSLDRDRRRLRPNRVRSGDGESRRRSMPAARRRSS